VLHDQVSREYQAYEAKNKCMRTNPDVARSIILPRRRERRQPCLKFHRPHVSRAGHRRRLADFFLPQVMQKSTHGFQAPSTALLRFLRHQLRAAPPPAPMVRRPRVIRFQGRAFTMATTASSVRHPRLVRLPFPESPPLALTCRATNHDRPLFPLCRCAATSLQEGFWRRLRRSRVDKPYTKQLKHGDLPPLSGFLDDNAGLGGRIIKPSNELKLRCTEFDENGNVTLVNGELKKSELTQKVRLPHCIVPLAEALT